MHLHPDTARVITSQHHYRVTGMTCDHCRRAITTGLSAVSGVVAVEVDVATGSVTVDADRALAEAAVAAAIHDAGYDLQT
jgi:copper chaperone